MDTQTEPVRRGRPTISPERKKTITPTFRVNAEELAEIETASQRAGQGLSTWIRETLLRAARRANRAPRE